VLGLLIPSYCRCQVRFLLFVSLFVTFCLVDLLSYLVCVCVSIEPQDRKWIHFVSCGSYLACPVYFITDFGFLHDNTSMYVYNNTHIHSVCVCMREREGGREGGREGERERERERYRGRKGEGGGGEREVYFTDFGFLHANTTTYIFTCTYTYTHLYM